MNAEEISNTLIELRRRIDNNETEENNNTNYHLDVSQLNAFITLLTDLNTLYEQEKIPKRPTVSVPTDLSDSSQTRNVSIPSQPSDENSSVMVGYGYRHLHHRHRQNRRKKEATTVSLDENSSVMVGYGCRHLYKRCRHGGTRRHYNKYNNI